MRRTDAYSGHQCHAFSACAALTAPPHHFGRERGDQSLHEQSMVPFAGTISRFYRRFTIKGGIFSSNSLRRAALLSNHFCQNQDFAATSIQKPGTFRDCVGSVAWINAGLEPGKIAFHRQPD
jgi:hypothetical protein